MSFYWISTKLMGSRTLLSKLMGSAEPIDSMLRRPLLIEIKLIVNLFSSALKTGKKFYKNANWNIEDINLCNSSSFLRKTFEITFIFGSSAHLWITPCQWHGPSIAIFPIFQGVKLEVAGIELNLGKTSYMTLDLLVGMREFLQCSYPEIMKCFS